MGILLEGAASALGWMSRHYRYSGGPASVVGRACGRGVRWIAPRVDADRPYTDINGYARRGTLQDHLELQGWLGVGRLPAYVSGRIKLGDWAIDAGANVGLITGQLCRLVGTSGRVWAIEPIPRNTRRLRELADLNGLKQLKVFEGALSNVAGEAQIHLPVGGHSGFASFTKSWDTSGTLVTPTWRLDDLIAGETGRVSFLKIDVEGFEPQVLEGAAGMIKDMRPAILCEFNDILLKDAGTSSRQLLAMFADLGYRPSPECLAASEDPDGQVIDLLLAHGA